MNRTVILAITVCVAVAAAFGAEEGGIANQRVEQRIDGSGLVDIQYDLLSVLKVIRVEVSFNDGKDFHFFPKPETLSGDVGMVRKGTNRHAVWNTLPELPQVSAALMRIRLTALSDYTVELASMPNLPFLREGCAMAVDTDRDVLVLFGGFAINESRYLNDLWEWNGTEWKQITATGPSPRSGSKMVYDKARKKMVLFGGTSNGYLEETWEWDGTAWTLVPGVGPSGRIWPAMVYDEERRQTILFGGYNYLLRSYPDQNDSVMWAYDGQKWATLPVSGPTQRHGHGMAYDPNRKTVIMYGGYGREANNSNFLADTWLWDGAQWTQMADSGPGVRAYFQMSYDGAYEDVFLLGGRKTDFSNYGDVWRWNGTSWSKLADGLAPSEYTGGGFVDGRSMVLRSDGRFFDFRYVALP